MADVTPPANTPVNKYSVHDLKNACDTRIVEYLEKHGFKESHTFSNLKIGIGMFSLIWTAIAYLNGKAFEEAYYIILISVVFYFIGSILYWLLEKYFIKNSFYTGFNKEYFAKNNIDADLIRISSDIKDHCQTYFIWPHLIKDGKEVEKSKIEVSFCNYFDERGYCLREKVNELAEEILKSCNNKTAESKKTK